jgi:type I restriction enzyme R subunit
VGKKWEAFVHAKREADLEALMHLKTEAGSNRRLLDSAFHDGSLKTAGTDADIILPPVSRFSKGGSRAEKKQPQSKANGVLREVRRTVLGGNRYG